MYIILQKGVFVLALVCDVELESGLTISKAYLKISSFSGSETHINFNLNVFINKTNFEEERPPITHKNYDMHFDKDRNLFRQMYEHLRTLPEYEHAIEA